MVKTLIGANYGDGADYTDGDDNDDQLHQASDDDDDG